MKCCFIGVGRMGRRHITAARNINLELVGVFDLLQDSLEAAVEECALPRDLIFGDVEEMFRTTLPEAVVIATTAPSHCEYVCKAAQAGVRYILCEKPMAISLAECDRMIEVCEANGAKLAINHQMRFMEQYTAVKEITNNARLGGLRTMMVTSGNFGLAMNGSHYFEAFRYLTGEPLTQVFAWFDEGLVPNPRGPEYIDHSGRLLGLSSSGSRLIMDFSQDLGHGLHVSYGCVNGQVTVDELRGQLHATYRQEEFRELPTTRYGMPYDSMDIAIKEADVLKPTEDLWKAMFDGGSYPDGRTGLDVMSVLVAANLAGSGSSNGVFIDQTLPRDKKFMWA